MLDSIDGFISDKKIKGNYLVYDTYGKIGFAYSVSYMDAEPKVYLKNLPNFENIYQYFLSCNSLFLKLNEKQDICLSLFYKPYFEEFYEKIKVDFKNISKNRRYVLKKFLLADLANPFFYKLILKKVTKDCEYYLQHDIFKKSNELLQILNW